MNKKIISIISGIILATTLTVTVYAEETENVWGEISATEISAEVEEETAPIWGEDVKEQFTQNNSENYDNEELKDGNVYEGAEWYPSLSGRLIRQGGRNSIDGRKCETKEETEALEARIRNENYILISTDDKDITDEEYNTYTSATTAPPFLDEIKHTAFGWDNKMYKVYLYRPVFEQALKEIEEYNVIKSITLSEIYESSVIIDYGYWYMKEKVGKQDNEFNDNIPSFYDTGFMQIISPVACEITILNSYEQGYYTFFVKADSPFLVKVKQGEYYIREINGTKIKLKEDLLPHTGIIWVQEENTEDNPFVIDLTEIVAKYNIAPQDISTEEDLSWENKDNIDYEEISDEISSKEVMIEETEVTPKEKDDFKSTAIRYIKWIFIIALVLLIILIIIKNFLLKKEIE